MSKRSDLSSSMPYDQLDQLVLGARVADIVIDGASSAAMVSGVRLRFSMPAMDMSVIEADAQPLRDGHFRAKGQFFTMAMGRRRSGFDPAQAIFPAHATRQTY